MVQNILHKKIQLTLMKYNIFYYSCLKSKTIFILNKLAIVDCPDRENLEGRVGGDPKSPSPECYLVGRSSANSCHPFRSVDDYKYFNMMKVYVRSR